MTSQCRTRMSIYFSSIYGQLSVSQSRLGNSLSNNRSAWLQVLTQACSVSVHSKHKSKGAAATQERVLFLEKAEGQTHLYLLLVLLLNILLAEACSKVQNQRAGRQTMPFYERNCKQHSLGHSCQRGQELG